MNWNSPYVWNIKKNRKIPSLPQTFCEYQGFRACTWVVENFKTESQFEAFVIAGEKLYCFHRAFAYQFIHFILHRISVWLWNLVALSRADNFMYCRRLRKLGENYFCTVNSVCSLLILHSVGQLGYQLSCCQAPYPTPWPSGGSSGWAIGGQTGWWPGPQWGGQLGGKCGGHSGQKNGGTSTSCGQLNGGTFGLPCQDILLNFWFFNFTSQTQLNICFIEFEVLYWFDIYR